MKQYHNERQEFCSNVFFSGLIMIIGALLISYIFYLIPFELTLIFSAIKVGLFFGLFWLITKKFHLYDIRFAIIIGIISGLFLFFLPHVLDYNYISNYAYAEGYSFGLSDYIDLFLGQEGQIIGIGAHEATSFDNGFFELFKLLIIIGGAIGVSVAIGGKPYSTLKKLYFNKTFSVSYNKYKDDILSKIDENNFREILVAFFDDERRFANINAEKGNFILFELEGEPKKIVEINNQVYLLDKEEYTLIKKCINHFFKYKEDKDE
ncbi:hypothetical protein HY636_04625 [Candidatus Woesearchaeota archaeon]|nr:hypothetical protein [Candidatus Woesearchaeota archaeon]